MRVKDFLLCDHQFDGCVIRDGYTRQNKFSNHPFLGFIKAVKNTKSNKEIKKRERDR